jgi:hypothetical protein
MSFNKYTALQDLNEEIKNKIEAGDFSEYHELQAFIDDEVENACIYYSDCFDIIKALQFIDFRYAGYEITNVSQAAAYALSEFFNENLDLSEFEEAINEMD